MKAKTSDSNTNCFSFASGYSLSLLNPSTISFSGCGIGTGGSFGGYNSGSFT